MNTELLATQNTLLALKKEAVAGVYETIGNNHFMPILNDVSDSTGHESIENKEMSGALDKKPNRLTMQTGSLEFGLYLRGHSDPTEQPWYQDALDTVFGECTGPFAGLEKATVGNAALLVVEGTPAVGGLDVTTAVTFFKAGDVVLVDTSVAKNGSRTEKVTIESVTFDIDHDELVFTSDLAYAPQVGATVQLLNRISIDGTPGLAVEDVILVAVGGGYEAVMITSVSGTVTQEMRVRPDLSAEPLNDAVVIGGYTNKTVSGSQDTVTCSVFKDCIEHDGIRKDFSGVRFNLALNNAAVGQLPELKLTGDMLHWRTVSDGTALATLGLTPNTGPAHDAPICLGVTLTLGDLRETLEAENFSFGMGYAIVKSKSMVQSSGVRSSRFRERKVTGTFDCDALDDARYAKALSSERPPLVAMFADENQTIVIMLPYIKQLDPVEKDVDGLIKHDVAFEADRTTAIGPLVLAFFPSIL